MQQSNDGCRLFGRSVVVSKRHASHATGRRRGPDISITRGFMPKQDDRRHRFVIVRLLFIGWPAGAAVLNTPQGGKCRRCRSVARDVGFKSFGHIRTNGSGPGSSVRIRHARMRRETGFECASTQTHQQRLIRMPPSGQHGCGGPDHATTG